MTDTIHVISSSQLPQCENLHFPFSSLLVCKKFLSIPLCDYLFVHLSVYVDVYQYIYLSTSLTTHMLFTSSWNLKTKPFITAITVTNMYCLYTHMQLIYITFYYIMWHRFTTPQMIKTNSTRHCICINV